MCHIERFALYSVHVCVCTTCVVRTCNGYTDSEACGCWLRGYLAAIVAVYWTENKGQRPKIGQVLNFFPPLL